jgi:hypothetical protein
VQHVPAFPLLLSIDTRVLQDYPGGYAAFITEADRAITSMNITLERSKKNRTDPLKRLVPKPTTHMYTLWSVVPHMSAQCEKLEHSNEFNKHNYDVRMHACCTLHFVLKRMYTHSYARMHMHEYLWNFGSTLPSLHYFACRFLNRILGMKIELQNQVHQLCNLFFLHLFECDDHDHDLERAHIHTDMNIHVQSALFQARDNLYLVQQLRSL